MGEGRTDFNFANMAKKQEVEMVEIVGPGYRDSQGFLKVQYPTRQVPKRLWDNPEHRQDLINAGMRLADDINEPSFDEPVKRGPGRPTTTQKQIDALAKKLALLEAENEALKEKQASANLTNDTPPDADQT